MLLSASSPVSAYDQSGNYQARRDNRALDRRDLSPDKGRQIFGTLMTNAAAVITETLELVAGRVGDPVPLVFQRLFREIPELEGLFIHDAGGLVRGQMFQVTIESLLDSLGDRSYGANLIQIERVNHVGLGVEPEMFDTFYLTVTATFKDILGTDWTHDMDVVWQRAVTELTSQSA
jgi:hemoglobin-like flavoprotein